MDTEAEWELIRRCRAGSAAAFEPLVRGHEARGLALARGLLGDLDDAADAVQEAFVRAYRSLDRLRDDKPFGPWFLGILRNHCLDRLRAPGRRRQAQPLEAIDERLHSEPTGTIALERAQLAELVRRALAELPPQHREVLVLKEVEELSYADIAASLDIPAGTVASRLYHARAALKKRLEARGVSAEEYR